MLTKLTDWVFVIRIVLFTCFCLPPSKNIKFKHIELKKINKNFLTTTNGLIEDKITITYIEFQQEGERNIETDNYD